jgi:hypothetical protein
MTKRKKRSPAWEAARAERKARRSGMAAQARDDQGYIIKVTNGVVTKHDPGEAQREAYLRARQQAKRESWEAPIG